MVSSLHARGNRSDPLAVAKTVENQEAGPISTIAGQVSPTRPGQVHARTVGSYVPRLTRKAFEKFGFATATLLTDWAVIVGAETARYTSPDRLRWPKGYDVMDESGSAGGKGRPGATLIVRAHAGRALDVQYRAQQIIDRINAYFGYRAVAELRIVQASFESRQQPALAATGPRAIINRPPRPLAISLERIDDAPLKTALERMRAGIEGRASGQRRS